MKSRHDLPAIWNCLKEEYESALLVEYVTADAQPPSHDTPWSIRRSCSPRIIHRDERGQIRSIFRTRCQGAQSIQSEFALDMKKYIEHMVKVCECKWGFRDGYVSSLRSVPIAASSWYSSPSPGTPMKSIPKGNGSSSRVNTAMRPATRNGRSSSDGNSSSHSITRYGNRGVMAITGNFWRRSCSN